MYFSSVQGAKACIDSLLLMKMLSLHSEIEKGRLYVPALHRVPAGLVTAKVA